MSGRIDSLRVVGTKHTQTIGKELTIRYALSRKCLYSSWFDVKHTNGQWVLTGHGWGHGAGLCQIGAAVMAAEGKDYETILHYYYPGTEFSRKS
jgi:SpoIID/LytB domain protein